MITAMRHLLGPGEAFKTKNNGDAVLIPAGLTIFHGTLGRYDWRTLNPWSWFATHMNSPVSMIGEHWKQGRETIADFDPRIYEFVTTRPLKLQLANAKGWTFALRAKAPIVDDELDKDDILASGFDGIISPYFEEEMRIGLRGDKFLKPVREHAIDGGMIEFNGKKLGKKTNLQGQTGIVGVGEFERREFDEAYLQTDDLQDIVATAGLRLENITKDERLFAYSLLRQSEDASTEYPSAAGAADAVFGYIAHGVGYKSSPEFLGHEYHLLIVWAVPTTTHKIFSPNGPPNTNTNVIADQTAGAADRLISERTSSVPLAIAGWHATDAEEVDGEKVPTLISLYGLARLGMTSKHRKAEEVLIAAFRSFIDDVSDKRPFGSLRVKGRTTPTAYIMDSYPSFVPHRSTKRIQKTWGVKYDRTPPFLAMITRLRRTEDDRLAEEHSARLLELWLDLEGSIGRLPQNQRKTAVEANVGGMKLLDTSLVKKLTPFFWALRLDLPAVAEAMIRTQLHLTPSAHSLSYRTIVEECIVFYKSRRCVWRWLFDDGGSKMLLALTNSDEKEVSEISHEKRREWYHFILDRRMVLLGVEDLEQARALSVMKNLIAVKTKDSETIRDVHYKLLPGASSVDDKVAMLKGLKELEFNHRDPIFPIDAGVVFDAFADLYNNEELAKKKVFMQLAEHWELFIVQETISIHSFNKLLRYVAIHASLEQGGRALAKLAIALASVIGTEREAKEAPLLLDKILFFAWRIGADVGQFAPRPLSFGPATDNDRNAIVQLANAYGQNPVKSKPLETALVQLLLLQENPFETVWEAKPAEGGRSVGELVGTGHYGQPIVVHRAFLEAELQRMKYPHSPAHFMDYDEAAKMWKAKHPHRWPDPREGAVPLHQSQLKKIGYSTAKKKYKLSSTVLDLPVLLAPKNPKAKGKKVFLDEELVAYAAKFRWSEEELHKLIEEHEKKVEAERERRRLREEKKKLEKRKHLAGECTPCPLCKCKDYPGCTYKGDACDTCIDGAGGWHRPQYCPLAAPPPAVPPPAEEESEEPEELAEELEAEAAIELSFGAPKSDVVMLPTSTSYSPTSPSQFEPEVKKAKPTIQAYMSSGPGSVLLVGQLFGGLGVNVGPLGVGVAGGVAPSYGYGPAYGAPYAPVAVAPPGPYYTGPYPRRRWDPYSRRWIHY